MTCFGMISVLCVAPIFVLFYTYLCRSLSSVTFSLVHLLYCTVERTTLEPLL